MLCNGRVPDYLLDKKPKSRKYDYQLWTNNMADFLSDIRFGKRCREAESYRVRRYVKVERKPRARFVPRYRKCFFFCLEDIKILANFWAGASSLFSNTPSCCFFEIWSSKFSGVEKLLWAWMMHHFSKIAATFYITLNFWADSGCTWFVENTHSHFDFLRWWL